MKYKEMLDFALYLGKTQGNDSEAWKKAMRSVNQLMELMGPYQLAMGNGEYRPISPEAYAKIEAVFDEAVANVNEYAQEPLEGPEDEARKQLMKNFNKEFLAKSYVEYKNVKPNPNESLHDSMEHFRYQNVELTGAELQRLGGNLNSRVQLNIDLDGVSTRGVFTKRTSYDPQGQFDEILGELKTKYGKFASFFDAMHDDPEFLRGGLFGNDPALFYNPAENVVYDSDPQRREQAVWNYHDSVGVDGYAGVEREFNKYAADPDFFNALFDYSLKAQKLSTNITVSEQLLGLKPGENIDGRNSAMSSVANLLGVSDLIAKSKQLAVKMPNGEFQTGTFMEFVESKDITHIDSIDEMRVLGLDAYEDPAVKVQLANLQVLDYVCGNVDRHMGNMLYQFDPETHKLVGVKGIDNDASFTKKRLANSSSLSQLPSINRMRVIDQDMAAKLLTIDDGALSATLHGYGLSQEEIEAAQDRLHHLQNAVRAAEVFDPEKGLDPYLDSNESGLVIVKTEDWAKLSLQDLRAGNNDFGKIIGVQDMLSTDSMVTDAMKQEAECSKRSLKSMLNPQNSADLLASARSHKPALGVSQRYKNVLDAMAAYQNAPSPEDPLHSEGHEKWQRLSDLRNAVNAYKQEKIGLGHLNPDGTPSPEMKGKALSRIEDVDKIGKFADLLDQQRKSAIAAERNLQEAERKQAELEAFKALPPDEQKIILEQRKAHEQYLNQDLSVRIQNSLAEEEASFESFEESDLSQEHNLSVGAVDPNN